MGLKVVRYRNHGFMNGSLEEEESFNRYDDLRFLFSFFELNNGKVHYLMIDEYWKGDMSVDINFEIGTTYFKIKNGNILQYKFGMDFWDWFNSPTYYDNIVEQGEVTEEEKKCIMDFYHKHLHNKREETQETVTL
jgi:hypothetical protein